MYKAVGSRGSRVNPVLWMLEELGQSYQFVEIKLRSPEAYALIPSGKDPDRWRRAALEQTAHSRAFVPEFMAMNHETQYSRLFRS